jgi:hypothetical protein
MAGRPCRIDFVVSHVFSQRFGARCDVTLLEKRRTPGDRPNGSTGDHHLARCSRLWLSPGRQSFPQKRCRRQSPRRGPESQQLNAALDILDRGNHVRDSVIPAILIMVLRERPDLTAGPYGLASLEERSDALTSIVTGVHHVERCLGRCPANIVSARQDRLHGLE